MRSKNPYDDYDKIDPWASGPDDMDDSGDFSFVEDEYDSMEDGVGDGFTYVDDSLNYPSAQSGSTEAFPQTQVRQAYGAPVDVSYSARSDGGVLKRRKRKRGGRNSNNKRQDDQANYGSGYQTNPNMQAGAYAQYNQGQMPQPSPQPMQPAIRRRKKHHFGCLFTILLFVVAVIGVYWVVAHPIDERLAFTPAEQETVNGTLSWSLPGMPYYVLALGSDAREGDEASRTDTMVLMRIDFFGGKVTMVSIPRDTMVEIDGYGRSKINAAYAYGGAGGAVRAVSKLTGTPINHVAVIHFDELVGLIDYLGGVTVNVPVDVNDPDYSGLVLSSGTQTMDGETALLWVRARHGFEDGDYQRQEDQRILITAIINRILSLSPSEMPGALKHMGGLVGTDLRCYDLAPLFVRFKISSPTIYSCAIPTTSDYIDGYWYEIVDEAGMRKLLQVVNSGGDPNTV